MEFSIIIHHFDVFFTTMPKPFLDDARRLTVSLGKDQRIFVEKIALQQRTSAATVIRWAVDRLKADHPEELTTGKRTSRA